MLLLFFDWSGSTRWLWLYTSLLRKGVRATISISPTESLLDTDSLYFYSSSDRPFGSFACTWWRQCQHVCSESLCDRSPWFLSPCLLWWFEILFRFWYGMPVAMPLSRLSRQCWCRIVHQTKHSVRHRKCTRGVLCMIWWYKCSCRGERFGGMGGVDWRFSGKIWWLCQCVVVGAVEYESEVLIFGVVR